MADPPSKPELEAGVHDTESLHYAAIGKVAAEWSWFEQWLDFKTIELGKIPYETGLCITAQVMGSARKLDAYIALSKWLGVKKTLRRLNHFAKNTASLAERRNRAVHDPWLVNQEGPEIARIEATARRTLRFLVIPDETAEIEKLSMEITQHISLLDEIHASVLSELNT